MDRGTHVQANRIRLLRTQIGTRYCHPVWWPKKIDPVAEPGIPVLAGISGEKKVNFDLRAWSALAFAKVVDAERNPSAI